MKTTKLARGIAAAMGLAVGGGMAAGCNLVVGAGDYHVASDQSGDATTPLPDAFAGAGDAFTAPDVTSPGNDANPPGNDATPPPGDDGAAPPGDDGGTPPGDDGGGADTGPTPTCGSTLLLGTQDFANLVRGCVYHFACSPTADNPNGVTSSYSIGTCIGEDDLGLFGATACEKAATDCADVVSCSGYGFATKTDCDGGTSVHCNGNVAVQCDPTNNPETYPGTTIDCNRQGGGCKVFVDTDAGDTTAQVDCEIVPHCPELDQDTACSDGGAFYECLNGVGYGQQCSNFQTHCDPSSPGCYYNSPGCDPNNTPLCSGGTAQYCYDDGNGGQLQALHCEHAGLACDDSSGTGTCYAPGCDPTACTESCNGSMLTTCVGGYPLAIDCSQYSPTKGGPGMTCRMIDVDGFTTVPHCLP
jgi:hypothetical protein